MPTISKFGFWAHLRAEPNEHILHFANGQLTRNGPGLAYWFTKLSASMAMVPVEDCEATLLFNELTVDFQEISSQITLTYRVTDPQKVVSRVNFSISPDSGNWLEDPLGKLLSFWSQLARQPSRAYLRSVTVDEAIRHGADRIRSAVHESLKSNSEVAGMGLAIVAIQVTQITPKPDLVKALETPTREAVQQKADEAVFQRRAQAVEKERAIKENELATQIELARRHEELIKRQGSNQLLQAKTQAEAERAKIEAEVERQGITATGYARDAEVRSNADAQSRRVLGVADVEIQAKIVELWKSVPADVIAGLSFKEFAGKISTINHLNITPDLVGEGLRKLLQRESES